MNVCITSAEAVTAVGHTAAETWASVVCGIRRTTAAKMVSVHSGDRARVAQCVSPRGSFRANLLAMVEPAVARCIAGAKPPRGLRVAVVACMPTLPRLPAWMGPLSSELAELRRELAALPDAVAGRVAELASVSVVAIRTHEGGRAVAAAGLSDACEILAAGIADACVVVAADSACETPLLEVLELRDCLHLPDRPTGFVPGEAAACLWLEPRPAREGVALRAATVGETLETAMAAALSAGAASAPEVRAAIADLNGERAAADRWLLGITRGLWGEGGHPERWFPAVSTGDLGAASAAVHATLSVARLLESPGVELVCAGAPDESPAITGPLRGAIVLSRGA